MNKDLRQEIIGIIGYCATNEKFSMDDIIQTSDRVLSLVYSHLEKKFDKNPKIELFLTPSEIKQILKEELTGK